MIGVILGILFGIGLLVCVWEFFKYWFGEFFEKKKPARKSNEDVMREFADKELDRAQRLIKQARHNEGHKTKMVSVDHESGNVTVTEEYTISGDDFIKAGGETDGRG